MDAVFIYVGQRACFMLEYGGFHDFSSNDCMKAGGYLGLGHSVCLAIGTVFTGLVLLVSLRHRRQW